jgi:hypothetical protein
MWHVHRYVRTRARAHTHTHTHLRSIFFHSLSLTSLSHTQTHTHANTPCDQGCKRLGCRSCISEGGVLRSCIQPKNKILRTRKYTHAQALTSLVQAHTSLVLPFGCATCCTHAGMQGTCTQEYNVIVFVPLSPSSPPAC